MNIETDLQESIDPQFSSLMLNLRIKPWIFLSQNRMSYTHVFELNIYSIPLELSV